MKKKKKKSLGQTPAEMHLRKYWLALLTLLNIKVARNKETLRSHHSHEEPNCDRTHCGILDCILQEDTKEI